MKVMNTGYAPSYISYEPVLSGGKTLQPGAVSAELGLQYIHGEVLAKEIARGNLKIVLNDADRAFLKSILDSDAAAVTMRQPPAPPAPPRAPTPVLEKPALQPVLKPDVLVVEPSAGERAVAEMTKRMGYKDISGAPKSKSLLDLMHENTVNLNNINPVQAQGAPVFGSDADKASLADIQTHMGSRV